MVYADTRFFIGLMDDSDEHHLEAIRLKKRYNSEIETSVVTIVELLKGCEERNLDAEIIVNSIFQMCKVSGITLQEAVNAARYVNEKKLKTIDAVHCSLSGGEIISFDKDFDKTEIKRISNEKN
ncbi:MAG: type II toxin-antitoxin system VapC family toxin [Candidatus Aenigmarchaeota archaeon]|nr:type II toxin-antitoxin system VapC family toxin [Candidatus Aenigmarchaeota archaeon]